MNQANLIGVHADVLLAGTAEINRWAVQNPTLTLDLRGVRATNSNLSGAILKNADLSRANFSNCKFVNADFTGAKLAETEFSNCDLSQCKMKATDVSRTRIYESTLDMIDFSGSSGVSQISHIRTCRLSNAHADASFEIARCRLIDRFLSWGTIRTVGQLRLFLPSYVALIVSVVSLASIGAINGILDGIRVWISKAATEGWLSERLSLKIIETVQPLQMSWRHLAVLAATLCLALASTIYLFCPSRIREFTIDQWKYGAGRPSFEYHIHTWTLPALRLCCVALYSIGGVIAAALLADTCIHAVRLIINGLSL